MSPDQFSVGGPRVLTGTPVLMKNHQNEINFGINTPLI